MLQLNERLVEVMVDSMRMLSDYRERLEDEWPTPETEDCFRFAATEAGEAAAALHLQAMVLASETSLFRTSYLLAFVEAAEALDVQLRQNARYSRNRERTGSILEELTDCAMMLMTALGSDFDLEDAFAYSTWLSQADGIEQVVSKTGTLVAHVAGSPVDWGWLYRAAAQLIADIIILVGVEEFYDLLRSRLDRIEQRIKARSLGRMAEEGS